MSYFITVTFDLKCAVPSVYPEIQTAIEELDFSKFVVGRRRIERQLPANTFVAEFDVDEFEHKREAMEWVSSELQRIFDALSSVRDRFFVSVGGNWAWTTADF